MAEKERERERERFIMQEVWRRGTGFLTFFIVLIDFRLSPSNALDVFGLKTSGNGASSLQCFSSPKPLNPDTIPSRGISNFYRAV